MAVYHVKNQLEGLRSSWLDGGCWVMSGRDDSYLESVDLTSGDGGLHFVGTIKYADDELMKCRATKLVGNNYRVEFCRKTTGESWQDDGLWLIGGRVAQDVVRLELSVVGVDNDLEGTMTYAGERSISFYGKRIKGSSYDIRSQCAREKDRWYDSGVFVLGTKHVRHPEMLEIFSRDQGKTYTGIIKYAFEESMNFRAIQVSGNNYNIENQEGGFDAPWRPGGKMVIGSRVNQYVTSLSIVSEDFGESFEGSMAYNGEGPIGVQTVLSTAVVVVQCI